MTRPAAIEWVRKIASRTIRPEVDETHPEPAPAGQDTASTRSDGDGQRREPVRPSSNEQGDGLALVVSFPKSGRTWLRVMLDELRIPCSYSHDRSSHREAFHMDDVNEPGAGLKAERFIFLHRDPRDTALSGYFQATKRLRNYDGDMSSFIRDPHHGVEKIARFNIAWLTSNPGNRPVYRLSYEQLTADAKTALVSLTDWLGVETTPSAIESVVFDNTFSKMRERELSGTYEDRYGSALKRPEGDDPDGFKVRRGQVGGFRDGLTDADIAYCDEVLARTDYWRHAAA